VRVDPLPSSSCFRWNEGLFCPAPRFAAGTRLQGAFASAPTGNAPAVRAVFMPDGSYELARATPAAAGSGRAAQSVRERGRYDIDGNVLRLRPAAGAPTALTLVPFDDGTPGPAPRRLFFGGVVLARE
jgi:hypothetical protein